MLALVTRKGALWLFATPLSSFLFNVFKTWMQRRGAVYLDSSSEIPKTLGRILRTLAKPLPSDQGLLLPLYVLAKDTLGSRTNFP